MAQRDRARISGTVMRRLFAWSRYPGGGWLRIGGVGLSFISRFGKTRAHCSCGVDCSSHEPEGIETWFRGHIESTALDAITDTVLAYRPKPKTKLARRRKRRAAKIAKVEHE